MAWANNITFSWIKQVCAYLTTSFHFAAEIYVNKFIKFLTIWSEDEIFFSPQPGSKIM